MSHRRTKGIEFDDDEVADYSDEYAEDTQEQEGIPEDQVRMHEGKAQVKKALGSSYSVSDKEIEEALWHYYYDVSKSVSYLKNLRPPQQPKKLKQASRFDQAANSAANAQRRKPDEPLPAYPVPIAIGTPFSSVLARDFFKDTPWLQLPEHRRGNISLEPVIPQLRLLGGSSKPSSKLAALAAARKKKEEEKRAAAPTTDTSAQLPDRAISLLDRLGSKASGGSCTEKNAPLSAPSSHVLEQARPRPYPVRPKKEPSTSRLEESKETVPPAPEATKPEPLLDMKAEPSTFARIMVGPHDSSHGSQNRSKEGSFFSVPPDDVVVNAQSKGSKSDEPKAKPRETEKATNGITEAVSQLSIGASPRVKSKNLNVREEFDKSDQKKSASFVVIGHVDHGKSTLMGRLLYDLKVIDQRSLDKLRKEADAIGKSSFALAWVMDQTSEERSRGVTVDIATNSFETEKTRFTILDAPGHRDFIPNMIAGASQADFAILVIDAGTNSFESGLKGQTKEHALLVRSMGVQRLIVAVNKMDMVSWSEDRFQEISQQMSAFLTSAGFQPKNVTFVPCSGLTGGNVVNPPAEGTMPWYTGQTLVQELDASETTKRAIEQPLRLSIFDIFRGGVTNPLSVAGRIAAGSLQVGDQVLAMPSGEKATIKGIEIDNAAADWAVAGQMVTLHLTDIDPVHLRYGDVLCSPSNPIKNVKSFTAKILAFEHVLPMSVEVHQGRLNVAATVSRLVALLDKATGEVTKKKPRAIQPGAVARVVVELENAIPLEGRVILRAGGSTVAAGLIESSS
ncbi:hypothetical protein H2201_006443 [Coniosporium apollinis]|uniref:Elongation factor 1-alpha n=1 Tax=Coniosporium apollinis TaxID=61459 RepID=A0ABQ9NLV7_9PEZI|nr:hypothetical protein H2201_006443 [Coniosporium apollinis]